MAIPSIPIPFSLEFLHEIFGGQNGGLITIIVVLLVCLLLFISIIWILIEIICHRKLNKFLLAEVIFIPLLFFTTLTMIDYLVGDRAEYIFSINKNKNADDFYNPFLSYQMRDCRNITEEFDIIFVPKHYEIETEYLAYAPRRKEKKNQFGRGKKLSDDWYLENSGSMWGEDLWKCYLIKKKINQ